MSIYKDCGHTRIRVNFYQNDENIVITKLDCRHIVAVFISYQQSSCICKSGAIRALKSHQLKQTISRLQAHVHVDAML